MKAELLGQVSYDETQSLEEVLAEVNEVTQRDGKTIVVMPAYNAVQTLRQTLADIPHGAADEIILVDDCSTDGG